MLILILMLILNFGRLFENEDEDDEAVIRYLKFQTASKKQRGRRQPAAFIRCKQCVRYGSSCFLRETTSRSSNTPGCGSG